MGQRELAVSVGQHSDRGRKDANQDFHGIVRPGQPDLGLKGIVLALADGISSSAAGAVASETAVKSFLNDYYAAPASWSVKTAAPRVIMATNSWLYAQTRAGHGRDDRDKGYVTTFSALVLKARKAHVFHVGDARVWRLAGRTLRQLTEDHRVQISSHESYLGRALGVNAHVDIDYTSVPIEAGDVFVLTTDGVHDRLGSKAIAAAIESASDLDAAARAIVAAALDAGSGDNLTVQIVRIDAVPDAEADDLFGRIDELAPAPILDPPTRFDGYDILRTLHVSHRSHVYLGRDVETQALVALKVPSVGLRDDAAYLRRFLMEEWIARRVDSPHVLQAHPQTRPRSHIYSVMAHCEGRTLAQWMRDRPAPDLESVRTVVEQIARGLQAFHRREMVHRDLRPENVMIDAAGTVRIIDFGATKVAGLAETEDTIDDAQAASEEMLGTLQYSAPECFLGLASTPASDIFSLGVIVYQMLTGRLPYGAKLARAHTRAAQRRLHYVSARVARPLLPAWVDGALRKAVHPDPTKRYAELSEFVHDLRHPNRAFVEARPTPLKERDPLVFWQMLSAALALAVVVLAAILVLAKR